jgi:signal transduction histidine kinase
LTGLLSRLNSIAARIAAAIVVAMLLSILTMFVTSRLTNPVAGANGDGSKSHLILNKSQFAVINPEHNPTMLSGRIVAIVRALASSSPAGRPAIAAAMTQPDLKVTLDKIEAAPVAESGDDGLYGLGELVRMQLETLSPPVVVSGRRLTTDRGGDKAGNDAEIDATLADGQRIIFTIPGLPARPRNGLLIFLISIVVVAVLVSMWTAHRIAAPIRDFAGAAERLGVDLTAAPLAVRGPRELRATIHVVNRMQWRLQRFLEDRTQMLAAISHDLRAPLARLRLRAELVAEPEQQQKMFDDLEAMNAMIDSTLAFAQDGARQEPRGLVDIGILVGDACEDAGDAGGEVHYAGGRGVDIPCRPGPVRRAVTNLIDNAVKYGGCAHVGITCDADRVVITIDDDGPGIAADEQERVFAPFYRLDPARNPAKAGVGLGLSIARTVAREHGGDVRLTNRDGGGLRAVIELPAVQTGPPVKV